MRTNPFEEISVRLENIENALKNIKITQEQENDPQNISVKEIAEALNVTDQSVRSYIKRGLIPACKIGRDYIIKRKDYEDSLKEVKSLKYRRDV